MQLAVREVPASELACGGDDVRNDTSMTLAPRMLKTIIVTLGKKIMMTLGRKIK